MQGRRHQAGIGTDAQAVFIAFPAAGQGDEPFTALALGEGASTPGRRLSDPLRHDPDLEDPRIDLFQVVLGMGDTGAGTHHLNIASLGTAFVAQVVLVADSAFAHIGDDFHVAVRVWREATASGNQVIVPDPQVAPVHPLRVVVLGKGEVMVGVEPAMVGVAKALEGAQLQHDGLSW